jgi:hypothetical protein
VAKIGRRLNRKSTDHSDRFVRRGNNPVLVPFDAQLRPSQPKQLGGNTELEAAESIVRNGNNSPIGWWIRE